MKFKGKNWLSPFLSAFSLVLVLLGWIIFAPQKIGGQSSYIIIVGNSMEPEFKYGDLVLVRKASNYAVGNIIAYNQPDAGIILHRIINVENGVYTLKGDNNSWEDSYNPGEKEIIGKLWTHFPSAGIFLQQLRTPEMFTFVVLIFLFLIIFMIFLDDPKFKKNLNNFFYSHKISNKDVCMENKQSDTLYLISVIGIIAFILVIVSFTRPLETSTADDLEYTHYGYFEYFADVPDDVFEGNVLQSGDPIFRQLNDSIEVSFSYEITSDQLIEIQGIYRLLAIINEASGWKRTIEIIPPSLIAENSFTSSGVLDLAKIQTLVDNFEEQTGISNNRYTLSIIPEVIIEGTVGGRTMEDTFSPELIFSFDDSKLIFQIGSSEPDQILNPISTGVVSGTQNEPNSISILGFNLNVLAARIISVFILLGAIIVFFMVLNKNKYHSSNDIKK